MVKGGTIEDGQIIRKVANNRMAVPKHFFMTLLKVKNGVYSSIAFLMEHKDYGYNRGNYAPLSVMAGHAVSVDELEEKTGIDFFHNLPNIVEAPVEQQCSPSAWGIQ
ncbi:MAG: DNA/RNA non-specific endonuclease [Bacteroidaceae bacterium]|nr:DNA/RNA non-specific endonuclease [Bacteroidaceae bacterium]